MSEMSIKRVTPPAAAQLIAENSAAILVDVRSKVEYDYVGHPVGAVNVIWKDYPTWSQNPDFAGSVRSTLVANGGDDVERPILVICRSGVRSMAAAETLKAAGYRNLYNVEEGFEGEKDSAGHRGNVGGWKFHGLAWEQT